MCRYYRRACCRPAATPTRVRPARACGKRRERLLAAIRGSLLVQVMECCSQPRGGRCRLAVKGVLCVRGVARPAPAASQRGGGAAGCGCAGSMLRVGARRRSWGRRSGKGSAPRPARAIAYATNMRFHHACRAPGVEARLPAALQAACGRQAQQPLPAFLLHGTCLWAPRNAWRVAAARRRDACRSRRLACPSICGGAAAGAREVGSVAHAPVEKAAVVVQVLARAADT